MKEKQEILYRANSIIDYNGHIAVYFIKYYVVSKTPCGKWLSRIPPDYTIKQKKEKFMLDKAKNLYAHPTKHEAIKSLWYRKRRQLEIIERQRVVAFRTLLTISDQLGFKYVDGEWMENEE